MFASSLTEQKRSMGEFKLTVLHVILQLHNILKGVVSWFRGYYCYLWSQPIIMLFFFYIWIFKRVFIKSISYFIVGMLFILYIVKHISSESIIFFIRCILVLLHCISLLGRLIELVNNFFRILLVDISLVRFVK